MKNLTEFLKILTYLTVIVIVGYFSYEIYSLKHVRIDGSAVKTDSLLKVNKKLMDSIDFQYKKLTFTEDSLRAYKDSLLKAKQRVYVKKISDLRYITTDSNIVIFTKLLSEESNSW